MKKLLALFLLIYISLASTWAQDTIYISKTGVPVKDRKLMDEYMFIQKDPANKNRAKLSRYFNNGKLRWEVEAINERAVKKNINTSGLSYSYMYDDIVWLYDGNYKEWYPSGRLYMDFHLITGGLVNDLNYYWENGNLKRHELYENSNCIFISGECYDKDKNKIDYFPSFVTYVYNHNGFKTLRDCLRSKVEYPRNARARKVETTIGVFANYDNEGNLTDAFVRHPIDKDLDSAAIALVKSVPKLDKPAYSDGKAIPQREIFLFFYNTPYIAYDLVNNSTGSDSVYVDKNNRMITNPKRAINILYFKPIPDSKDEVSYKIYDSERSLVSMTRISKKSFNEFFRQVYKDPYKNVLMPTKLIIDLCIKETKVIENYKKQHYYETNNF